MGVTNAFMGAKAVITNNNHCLVLKKNNGSLDLPGGRGEHNESLAACINREISEETGLLVMDFQPLALWSIFKPGHDRLIQGITFLGRSVEKTVYLSSEHEGFEWIDAEAFFKIRFKPSFGLNPSLYENFVSWQRTERIWRLPQRNSTRKEV